MSLTTDRNDPRLTKGVDAEPVPQAPVYLVLSEAERARGFVRPYRDTYEHVGDQPKHALRALTPDELEQYKAYDYVAYEAYPPSQSATCGRFWTQRRLDSKGCGTATTMARPLSETYAREPHFYGSTYCVHCSRHLPVTEFRWIEMDGTLGPKVGS